MRPLSLPVRRVPAYSESAPVAFTAISKRPRFSLSVRFAGFPGETYAIQASTDLVHWVTLGSTTATSEGVIQFDDRESAKYPSRFYRIVVP